MSTQPSRKKYIFLAINLFWFLVIAYLTHITPVHSDDIILAHIYGTEKPIRSLHDFFLSVWIHQMTWGGDFIGWGVYQLFAIMPRIVFELCNGLVWVGAANLLCRFSCTELKTEEEDRPILLCLVYLSLWFFSPVLRDSLWLNAAISYLWFNTAALLFCRFFYQRALSQNPSSMSSGRKTALCALLLLLGFAVGNCVSPPTGCAVLAGIGLRVLWELWKKRSVDILLFAGALGTLIGFCISVFSPGNFTRVAFVAEQAPYTASLLFRIARTSYYGLRFTLVPLAITLFFVVLNRARYPYRRLDELFFVLLAFVNIAVMAIPNGYAQRTVLFSDMLLIIAGARSALRYFSSSPCRSEGGVWPKRAAWVLIAVLMVFVLLEITTGVMMHFRNGTTFNRETIYYLVKHDLF